jgi:hypothetical protein
VQKCKVQVDEVMRHVLHEQSPVGHGIRFSQQIMHYGIAVTIHGRNDVLTPRVVCARNTQIMAIKRFIDDPDTVIPGKTVH